MDDSGFTKPVTPTGQYFLEVQSYILATVCSLNPLSGSAFLLNILHGIRLDKIVHN